MASELYDFVITAADAKGVTFEWTSGPKKGQSFVDTKVAGIRMFHVGQTGKRSDGPASA